MLAGVPEPSLSDSVILSLALVLALHTKIV